MLLAACSGATHLPEDSSNVPAEAVETVALPTSTTQIVTPGPEPSLTPSPTPQHVLGMSPPPDWRPPAFDGLESGQAGDGVELPKEIQEMLVRAQETVANTGYVAAQVEVATNGLSGEAFQVTFVAKTPGGEFLWAEESAYPSLLNTDGSFQEGVKYVVIRGSAGAELMWSERRGTATEPSLVLPITDSLDSEEIHVLVRNPATNSWQPLDGYSTAEDYFAVGEVIYRFYPEDGNVSQVGSVPGLASIQTQGGRVEFVDANGVVSWFDSDRAKLVNEQILLAERTGVPDAAEYSLGQLGVEKLVPYKEVTYLSGETYELFGDEREPNIVYLARNKETGEVMHALYIEARPEGGIPVLMLTSSEVAEGQGYFVSFNPDAIDVTTVDATGEGGQPVSRAKAYELMQRAYEQLFAINNAYQDLEEYQYLRIDGQRGYYPAADMSLSQRQAIVDNMVAKWRQKVATVKYPYITDLFENRPLTMGSEGVVVVIQDTNKIDMKQARAGNTTVLQDRIEVGMKLDYRGLDGGQYIASFPISALPQAFYPLFSHYAEGYNFNTEPDRNGYARRNYGLAVVTNQVISQGSLPGFKLYKDQTMTPDFWGHKDNRKRGDHWDSRLLPGLATIDAFLDAVSVVKEVPVTTE